MARTSIMTFLLFSRSPAHSQIGLFKGSPFEILLVSSALHLPALALMAGRLRLVTLQPLGLAGNTTWASRSNRVSTSAAVGRMAFIDAVSLEIARTITTLGLFRFLREPWGGLGGFSPRWARSRFGRV